MTFYEYMMKFYNDDSPIGDLAYDIKWDEDFPIYSTDVQHIRDYLYLKSKTTLVWQVCKQAIASYARVEKYL